MSTKHMAALIQDFRDDTIRNTLGPSLALITPGHWDLFITWAGHHGYTLSAQDIRSEIANRPEMMKSLATHPRMALWSANSLDQFVAAAEVSAKGVTSALPESSPSTAEPLTR